MLYWSDHFVSILSETFEEVMGKLCNTVLDGYAKISLRTLKIFSTIMTLIFFRQIPIRVHLIERGFLSLAAPTLIDYKYCTNTNSSREKSVKTHQNTQTYRNKPCTPWLWLQKMITSKIICIYHITFYVLAYIIIMLIRGISGIVAKHARNG